MSTATLDAPAATEPAKVEAIPPSTAERDAIVAMFKKPKTDITSVIQPKAPEPAKVEPAKTEPAKTEPAKEEKKPDEVKPAATEVKIPEVVPPVGDKETNLANLRKKAEEAERRAAELEAQYKKTQEEYETYKKNPIPKEYEERLTKAEQERAEYQKRLQAADLARDPAFQQKYNAPIKSAMAKMVATAVASGVPKADAERAVAAWDESTFKEWAVSMDELDKVKFGGAMQRAVELYDAKEAEIQNAEQTWSEMQKAHQREQEASREAYMKNLSADVEGTIKELTETELWKSQEEAAKEATAVIRRAAGLDGQNLSNRELLGMAGKAVLLSRAVQLQELKLGEKDAKIAEMEKKIAEQEAFIKGEASSTPGISSGVSKGIAVADKKAVVAALLNPRVG